MFIRSLRHLSRARAIRQKLKEEKRHKKEFFKHAMDTETILPYLGLKVSDYLVAYATGFLFVCLKIHMYLHLCAVKPKAQCD